MCSRAIVRLLLAALIQTLNTRDRSDLVALEAVRALFGALPAPVPPLFAAPAASPPADDPRDARCCPALLLFC